MNDFIFNILPAQGPTIWGWPINSPLTGSFLGVIAGFGINYVYQSYNNYKNKIKIKKLLRFEIEACIEILNLPKIQLLPTDNWNSSVNSGAIKFLDVETELDPLSKDYYKIKHHHKMVSQIGLLGVPWTKIESGADPDDELQQFGNSRQKLLTEFQETLRTALRDPGGCDILKADEYGAYWGTKAESLWQYWSQFWK
jgi:hypothetical protein